jgi:formate dehydrogenase major subunit
MAITRRDFLKYTAVMGGGLLLGSLFDLAPVKAYAEANPPVWTSEAVTVCGYCSVGCSMIVGSVLGSTLTNGIATKKYAIYVQGNGDSPINKGTLCSKGSASAQFSTIIDNDPASSTYGQRIPNPERLTEPLRRLTGETTWTSIPWATAYSEIAARVKATRNATLIDIEPGSSPPLTVNRCTGIATLGASSLSNEAAYLITKLNRALGVVYLETQARN